MHVERLKEHHFSLGFLETLAALKPPVTENLEDILRERGRNNIGTYVVVDNNRVIATASIFIERKFINGGKRAAHVEDVAVHPDHQGCGAGRFIMEFCEKHAVEMGCYKIILNCSETNKGFYRKLGYQDAEFQMRKSINL